jgi:hypothetical protein
MGKKSNRPHNTVHNWLDMLFRGFSEEAKKDFKENQESSRYYPPARDIEKYERRLRREMEINYPGSGANFMPDLVSGGQPLPGFIPRPPSSPQDLQGAIRPRLVRPSSAQPAGFQDGVQVSLPPYATQDPQRPRPSQNSNQRPQPGRPPPRQSQAEDERTETEIALAQLENVSPQRPAQRASQMSAGQTTEPSAIAASEASHASTARVPTERAELFDNRRTYIEGMSPPSGYPSSRRSQRRPSRR